MFGARFWGNRFFGGRYWGHVGAEGAPTFIPLTVPAGANILVLIGNTSGLIIGEIRPRIESVVWRLNDVGQATLSLAKTDPKLAADFLRFGNRILIQFDNGLPNWGGIIDPPRKWTSPTVDITAYSGEYLFGLRQTEKSLQFTNAVVGDVYQQVVQGANSVYAMGISLGIVWKGGSLHSPEYHFTNLLEIIRNGLVEKLSTGDFDVMASELAGHIVFTANLHERRGRNKPEVALLAGRNIAEVSYDEQGPIVNSWDFAGEGTDWGDDRPTAIAQDGSSISSYGFRQGSQILTDVSETATLYEAAVNRLAESKDPHNIFSLTAINRAPGQFKDYDLGDAVYFEAAGYGFDGGFAGMIQILGRDYNADTGLCGLVVREAVA
jgi:hypothetical protein